MKRSKCPISNALDHVGDKWSLLILRDIILYGKSTYKELQESDERIATNILSDRLVKLEVDGLIKKEAHKKDKRKKVYKSTEKGLHLVPLLIEMIIWSKRYYPETYVPNDFLNEIDVNKEELIRQIISNNS